MVESNVPKDKNAVVSTFILDRDCARLRKMLDIVRLRNERDLEREPIDVIDKAASRALHAIENTLNDSQVHAIEEALNLPCLSYEDIDNRSITCYSIARCIDKDGAQIVFYVVPMVIADLVYIIDRTAIMVASPDSPIGKALLNRNLMETVTVSLQKGDIQLTIIDHHLHFFTSTV